MWSQQQFLTQTLRVNLHCFEFCYGFWVCLPSLQDSKRRIPKILQEARSQSLEAGHPNLVSQWNFEFSDWDLIHWHDNGMPHKGRTLRVTLRGGVRGTQRSP